MTFSGATDTSKIAHVKLSRDTVLQKITKIGSFFTGLFK